MASEQALVRVTRWQGGQHPTISTITRQMQKEGLRPYLWSNSPNQRLAVRSHGYDRIVYVVEGAVEIVLPDANQRVALRSGDRVEIPAGVRHGTVVARNGARGLEAALDRGRRRVV